jgi:hypothetical protein
MIMHCFEITSVPLPVTPFMSRPDDVLLTLASHGAMFNVFSRQSGHIWITGGLRDCFRKWL